MCFFKARNVVKFHKTQGTNSGIRNGRNTLWTLTKESPYINNWSQTQELCILIHLPQPNHFLPVKTLRNYATLICVCARMYEQTWSLVLRHSFTATMKHTNRTKNTILFTHSLPGYRTIAKVYRAPHRKKSAFIVKKATHSQSHSYITTDSQSASPSWCQAPIWDPRPISFSFKFCLDGCGFVIL
jgi:hypothetical protein